MDKKTFRKVMSDPTTRRQFLGGAGLLAGLVIAHEMPVFAQDKTGIPSNPFTLGVASGDPMPDGVVIWTRLAPGNPALGAWNSKRSVAVQWEVATDEAMTKVVQRGTYLAIPQFAHSVHVELAGLRPFATYYYRFRAGSYVSPVGITKTAPAPGAKVDKIKFAFCSCSDYQNGFFAGYGHMGDEDIDFWLHVGDYIYEYGPNPKAVGGRQHTTPDAGAAATQLTTLGDYRNRHSQYKMDTQLAELHRRHPLIAIWDDHEVENNYANLIDETDSDFTPPDVFKLQRAAAYQAYYENMPLRRSSLPNGADMQLYRRLTFGNLLELNMLDTRQFRTDQPIDTSTPIGQALGASDFRPSLPPNGNPTGTLMGDVQENWLLDGLATSRARWNVIGNQVMMAQFDYDINKLAFGVDIFNMDQWDGYGAARQRVLDFMAKLPTKNFVVLTGDIHSAWAHNLKQDFSNDKSATVATEFICTSITADFPSSSWQIAELSRPKQSWAKYLDARRRGYVLCTVTPDNWQTDFRAVISSATAGQVLTADAAVSTTKTLFVQNGIPGIA